MAAINDLVESEYKRPPRVLPFSIHIRAQSGLRVCDKKGKLQPISPIEPRHAVIKALAKRIREKAPHEELGLIATPPPLHPNSQMYTCAQNVHMHVNHGCYAHAHAFHLLDMCSSRTGGSVGLGGMVWPDDTVVVVDVADAVGAEVVVVWVSSIIAPLWVGVGWRVVAAHRAMVSAACAVCG